MKAKRKFRKFLENLTRFVTISFDELNKVSISKGLTDFVQLKILRKLKL